MKTEKLFDLIEELEPIECVNCGQELEYNGEIDSILEVYKNYGGDGLFGRGSYLVDPNDVECDTCYYFTEISKPEHEKIVKTVKEIIGV